MQTHTSGRTRCWLLPLLSGVFIGTSYIPFPPWASLFCFVPLWLYWHRQTSFKGVLLGGLLTSAVFTIIGFNWMTYLLHEFARLDWPFAVLGMAGFAVVAHLYVPVAGVLWFWGQRRFRWSEPLSLASMAIITTLCEAYSVTLFDWNFGYSWYGAGLPIYHCAEIVGFSGLSAATLMTNLPLYYAWKYRSTKQGALLLGGVIAVFLVLNGVGLWFQHRLPPPDARLKVALVQGNIGNLEPIQIQFGDRYPEEIIRRYLRLTDRALESAGGDIDFALWPETAFPTLLGERFAAKHYPSMLKTYLKDRKVSLVTGAYSLDEKSGLPTNSLFALNRDGDIAPPGYSKTILLAFGEYIPGETLFPFIRDWLPETGQFARGDGPTTLLKLGDLKMGPQVCYESLFPAFSRSLANLGAQFIVNVTNDSWYGDWQEPYQHMYMTLARGVETRRPVLRVTNTGISTAALASGEILARSPIGQEWSGVYDIPYLKNPPPTFYQRWPWLVPGLLWGSLVVLLGLGVKRRQEGA
jgi:apolipoprotein N-acyltransferase